MLELGTSTLSMTWLWGDWHPCPWKVLSKQVWSWVLSLEITKHRDCWSKLLFEFPLALTPGPKAEGFCIQITRICKTSWQNNHGKKTSDTLKLNSKGQQNSVYSVMRCFHHPNLQKRLCTSLKSFVKNLLDHIYNIILERWGGCVMNV